ncbi:MAG: hypothetical protein HKN08_05200, partial [Gammaproteobacteria bacterium]|nr:hypothetical protein [Gammaproteobacteria bacterium]
MPVTEPDNYFLHLKDFGLLEVTGEDAEPFLQSQLTSDISILTTGDAQFSSWCNPQGRIISTILLFARDNAYFILLPVQLVDIFTRKLSMYILRSKVTITPFDASAHIIGIYGEDQIKGINDHIT